MNANIQWKRGLVLCLAASALFGSCAKFENREFYVDKPQSLIDQEYRNSFNTLKSYVDPTGQPHFKLGAEMELTTLTNYSLLYQVLSNHFDEINLTNGQLNHMIYVKPDGSLNTDTLSNALDGNHEKNKMPIHAGHLLWHQNQQATYLNSLIADVTLVGSTGTDNLVDFENDAVGTTYPVTSTQVKGTVMLDPVAATTNSGKVLNVLASPGTGFPQFRINLPDGRKLGNYTHVTLDFRGDGCCGFYGAGMRLAISSDYGNPNVISYGGPSSFGVPLNGWGRGLINLPLAALNLTNTQKELTTFILTVGSQTGAPNYLIDNIKMKWEIPGETIVKTPAEKKAIIEGQLDRWIKAIAEKGKDKIQSWSVVYQPINETDPTMLRTGIGATTPLPANTFYWQDYLGKDYAAIAINMLRQYVNAGDKMFITENNLLDNPAKVQGLIDFVSYTEGKGVVVDGIATEFAFNGIVTNNILTGTPLQTNADKAKVETALQTLAASGKLIKIAALDIGTATNTTAATPLILQEQSENYKWFVNAYYRFIPANQRAGITLRSPTDQIQGAKWRPNEPVGIFTNNRGYERKPAYVGLLEALQGTN